MPNTSQLTALLTNPAAPRQQQLFAWLILKSARGQIVCQSRLHELQSAPGAN